MGLLMQMLKYAVEYPEAIELIKEFEGFHSVTYRCPAGVPTIGYGSTHWPNGKKVAPGQVCSEKLGETMVLDYIDKHVLLMLCLIPSWYEMSAKQQAALISFSYNLGPNWYGQPGFETISKRIREKDWDDVPAALMLYCNPGSSAEAGLRRRRAAEGQLWREGMTVA